MHILSCRASLLYDYKVTGVSNLAFSHHYTSFPVNNEVANPPNIFQKDIHFVLAMAPLLIDLPFRGAIPSRFCIINNHFHVIYLYQNAKRIGLHTIFF